MDAMADHSRPRRYRRHHGPIVPFRRLLVVVAVILASSVAVPARADDVWAVRSGQVHLHLNVELLRDLGIEVEVSGAGSGEVEGLLIEEPYWTFSIRPGFSHATIHASASSRDSTRR